MTRRKEFPPAALAEEARRLVAKMPVRSPKQGIDPAGARAEQAVMAATRAPGPNLAKVEDFQVATRGGRLKLRCYSPGPTPPAIILYFHGGGWVMGSIDDSDAHVRRVVEATDCAFLSVDYRLAPEHPFPAAIDDAIDAWAWLRANAPQLAPLCPLGIAGDSAGGNIAAGTCLALRDADAPLPAFQILVYPVLSPAMDTPSYRAQAEGPILTAADMAWFWDCYARETGARHDPRAAPMLAANLAGLPPALILTAECDPLRDEGMEYSRRLAIAGVPVRQRCFEGMPHGFYKSADLLAGGQQALAEVAAFLRERTGVMPDAR